MAEEPIMQIPIGVVLNQSDTAKELIKLLKDAQKAVDNEPIEIRAEFKKNEFEKIGKYIKDLGFENLSNALDGDKIKNEVKIAMNSISELEKKIKSIEKLKTIKPDISAVTAAYSNYERAATEKTQEITGKNFVDAVQKYIKSGGTVSELQKTGDDLAFMYKTSNDFKNFIPLNQIKTYEQELKQLNNEKDKYINSLGEAFYSADFKSDKLAENFKRQTEEILNGVNLQKNVELIPELNEEQFVASAKEKLAKIESKLKVELSPTIAESQDSSNDVKDKPVSSDSSLRQEINDVDTLKTHVNELKDSLHQKTEQIVIEENQMRQSAAKEVQSIQAIRAAVREVQQAIEKKTRAIAVSEQNSRQSIGKEIASFVEIAEKVDKLSTELNNIAKIKIPTIKIDRDYGDESQDKKSVNADLNRLTKLANKSDQLSTFANALKEISNYLMEIDKCINVPDIFDSLNSTKKSTGTYLSDIGVGLEGIRNGLKGLTEDDLSFLNNIKEILGQADALKDLAQVLRSSQRQINQARNTVSQSNNNSNDEARERANKIANTIEKFESIRFGGDLLPRQEEIRHELLLNNEFENGTIQVGEYNTRCNELIRTFQQIASRGKVVESEIKDIESAEEAILNDASRQGEIVRQGKLITSSNGISKMAVDIRDAQSNIQKLEYTWDGAMLSMANKTKYLNQSLTGVPKIIDTIQKKVGELFVYWTATYLNPYDIIRYVKEGVQVVTNLDSALTELRKVSDETISSLKAFQNESFGIAKSVGSTSLELQNSTADWMRLGESLNEAKESAKDTSILLNVSEFQNVSDATDALVSMSQAYKDLDKLTIVDKLNEVGNNYAISTDELARGLQKSSATLSLLGNTIDESAALITTANTIMQDVDSVSAGIRTVSLRIIGTEQGEEELKAMGEEVDNFVKSTNSKKQQIIKDYSAVASNGFKGFDILNDSGNYKNTYEILLGISQIYKEIQQSDKELGTNRAQALIEELGGKNRSSVVASILQNPELLQSVKNSSENAEGSAMTELEKQLDSIEGKMKQLQTQAQEFWSVTINSDSIKNVVSALTGLLNVITKISDKTGGLTTILATLISTYLSTKNVGRIKLY